LDESERWCEEGEAGRSATSQTGDEGGAGVT